MGAENLCNTGVSGSADSDADTLTADTAGALPGAGACVICNYLCGGPHMKGTGYKEKAGDQARMRPPACLMAIPLCLRVEPPQRRGLSDATNSEHVGGCAHADLPIEVNLQHLGKAVLHHSFQTVVHVLRFPEQVLLVLNPFKVRNRNATGVAEDIGNNEYSLRL